ALAGSRPRRRRCRRRIPECHAKHRRHPPPGGDWSRRKTAKARGSSMSELGMEKVRGVFRRRKVAVIATAVGVLGVAAALIYQVEPGYKASAVIRVGEVQPAKEYVAPTVAEQVGERLKSLRLAVMARPIVLEAANALGIIRDPKKA